MSLSFDNTALSAVAVPQNAQKEKVAKTTTRRTSGSVSIIAQGSEIIRSVEHVAVLSNN